MQKNEYKTNNKFSKYPQKKIFILILHKIKLKND